MYSPKIFLRKFLRHPSKYIFNLVGITLSLCFSYVIYSHISNELSYDEHHTNKNRVYRLTSDFTFEGQSDRYANTPRPVGAALVREYPGIVASVKIIGFNGLQNHSGYLNVNGSSIRSKQLFASEATFFEVFDQELISGTKDALKEPNSIVITQSLAKKLFGEAPPMGQIITLEDNVKVEIKAVIKDSDNSTHLPFEALVSYSTYFDTENTEKWWFGGHVYTYVLTTETFNPKTVYNDWDTFHNKYFKSTLEPLNGQAKIIFQPVTDIHLAKPLIWEPYPHGNKSNLIIFGAIAIFLLVMACFNQINLSLSSTFKDMSHVATKKAFGARRSDLIKSDLIESAYMWLLGALHSIALLAALVPAFSQYFNLTASLERIGRHLWLLEIALIAVICSVIAAIVPAIINSRTSQYTLRSSAQYFFRSRRTITTLQQVLAFSIVTFTLVVFAQIQFVQNRDHGFESDNLLIINIEGIQFKNELTGLINDLRSHASINGVSLADETPLTGINEFTFQIQAPEGKFTSTPSQTIAVGDDYLSTMGLKLLAGRPLDKRDNHYRGVLINQRLADKHQIDINNFSKVRMRFNDNESTERWIVGVVENFSLGSAHEKTQGMAIGYRDGKRNNLIVSAPSNELTRIKQIWNDNVDGYPMIYAYMTDELNLLHEAEVNLYHLLVIGCFMIILIAMLGQIGLSVDLAMKRSKEIAIRKVCGANNSSLVVLMFKGFMINMAVTILIGSGVAWYLSNQWLNNFHYRLEFNFQWVFIAGLISILPIVGVTFIHTLKISQSNPAVSLKFE
ncbi:MAG: ABC transporter permease [Cyclobacteriaceae bacterium]